MPAQAELKAQAKANTGYSRVAEAEAMRLRWLEFLETWHNVFYLFDWNMWFKPISKQTAKLAVQHNSGLTNLRVEKIAPGNFLAVSDIHKGRKQWLIYVVRANKAPTEKAQRAGCTAQYLHLALQEIVPIPADLLPEDTAGAIEARAAREWIYKNAATLWAYQNFIMPQFTQGSYPTNEQYYCIRLAGTEGARLESSFSPDPDGLAAALGRLQQLANAWAADGLTVTFGAIEIRGVSADGAINRTAGLYSCNGPEDWSE